MKNYRDQDGCNDCRHAFVRGDYDQGDEYFCAEGAGPRPLCMSVGMGEYVDTSDLAWWNRKSEEWEEWSRGRSVNPWGTCDSFEGKED